MKHMKNETPETKASGKWRMDLLLIFGMVLVACLFLLVRHISRESAVKNEKSSSLTVTAEVDGKDSRSRMAPRT